MLRHVSLKFKSKSCCSAYKASGKTASWEPSCAAWCVNFSSLSNVLGSEYAAVAACTTDARIVFFGDILGGLWRRSAVPLSVFKEGL